MARIMRKEGSIVPRAVTMLPPYSTQAVAYEYGYVDRKDARRRLGDGKQVYKILFGYPPAFRYDFVLNQWNHGIAAANGECTDFKRKWKMLRYIYSSYHV